MKKIFYLIGISALFLVASCSNDDITQSVSDVKLYTPTLQGSFGKLTEANPDVTTKSGVIEENENYATEGEQFYWHDGDQVKLLFFANGDIEPSHERIYTAVVADGEKPDKAAFIPDPNEDGIPGGTYTVYGLYPAAGWTREGTEYKASMVTESYPFIPISEASSKHLGRYMFMKAKAEDVEIGDNGTNTLDLSYQHLASVIRVHITNNNPTSDYPRLFRLSMGVNTGAGGNGFNSEFNPVDAYLDGGIDGTRLDPGLATPKVNLASVQIVNDELNGLNFDLFIPILPTGTLESNTIRFQGRFYANENDEAGEVYTLTPPIDKDVSTGPGLSNGFEAGKSYVFNLTIPPIPPVD